MRTSLVRFSLPALLFLLLGVLLAVALMLAGKPSAAPAQNGFTKPEVKLAGPMQNGMDRPVRAGPEQNGFAKPDVMQGGAGQGGFIIRQAAPMQSGFARPTIMQAGPMHGGLDQPVLAGPTSIPLTIPYVAAVGTSIHGGPTVEA